MRTRIILSLSLLVAAAQPALAQRAPGPSRPASSAARPAATTSAAQSSRKIIVGTKPARSTEVTRLGSQIGRMKSFVLDVRDPHYHPNEPGSTPAFQLHVVAGTSGRLKMIRAANESDEFNRNAHAQYEVEALGADKTLNLSALLPSSGHVRAVVGGKQLTKRETAQHYADVGHYAMKVTYAADEKALASGESETVDQILPKGEIVKAHELAIKMDKPGVYRVQWWPKPTGIDGYWTGRTIDLIVK